MNQSNDDDFTFYFIIFVVVCLFIAYLVNPKSYESDYTKCVRYHIDEKGYMYDEACEECEEMEHLND